MITNPIEAGFKGAALRMSTADLAAEAGKHGYELAVVQAVLDVESSGSGFDEQGRPKILTEPHIFYAQLASQPAKRDQAVSRGVAYPHWGEKPYPPTSQLNYERLEAMCAIDTTAALKSVSWGSGQVMGFNFAACGYTTVQTMVLAAMDSEAAQLDFLIDYANHAGLDHALKTKDWEKFAAGYNGPGAVAAYSAKLRAAYARHFTNHEVGSPVFPAPPVTTSSLNDREWLRIRAGVV